MHLYRVRGFSLLELSLVITIVALLMAGMLNVATQKTIEAKQTDLIARMDAIESALKSFRKANNRLPCPATGSTLVSVTGFGKEDSHPGTCSGAMFINSGVAGGVVPTRTLGLPDEAMFDPWGNRFSYAVDVNITKASAFSLYGATSSAIGAITVKSGTTATTPMTAKAIAIVLSHGANGHGAFQLSGLRKNAASTNLNEKQNCHCDGSGVATSYNATFIQAVSSESATDTGFDDKLRYYLRPDFLAGSELLIDK